MSTVVDFCTQNLFLQNINIKTQLYKCDEKKPSVQDEVSVFYWFNRSSSSSSGSSGRLRQEPHTSSSGAEYIPGKFEWVSAQKSCFWGWNVIIWAVTCSLMTGFCRPQVWCLYISLVSYQRCLTIHVITFRSPGEELTSTSGGGTMVKMWQLGDTPCSV